MFSRSMSRITSTAHTRWSSTIQKNFASVLVVAEHDGKSTISAGTLSAVTAASKIGGEITLLVTGKGVADVASAGAKIKNISKVLVADHEALTHHLPEDMTNALKEVIDANKFSHILAASSNISKSYIPRLSALLDISPITDVIAVVDETTFKRPIYAGNAIATVQASTPVKIVTVRITAFDKAEVGSDAKEIIQAKVSITKSPHSQFISSSIAKSERPDLTTARVVVSGGRGLKSGENFKILEKLADKLGGAVGASRAAVDAGFVPNEYQVGQTGKVVAPDLYIAVGISGAIQHLSGMKDSKTIVAINKDKEAPIFQVADYGLVADLFTAVPELEAKL